MQNNDSRRKLEGAGFRTDVQNIKNLLAVIDRKFHEVTRRVAKEKGSGGAPVRATVSSRATVAAPVPSTKRPARLKSAPTLGIKPTHDKSPPRAHRHRHHRPGIISKNHVKSHLLTDDLPTVTCITSMKDYVAARQVSSAALSKLLQVAQEKVKFLDQLVKKTSAQAQA